MKDKKSQVPLSQKKGVKYMASPIEATPVLKGNDLKSLIEDLKKPDLGRERRKKGLQVLRAISKPRDK